MSGGEVNDRPQAVPARGPEGLDAVAGHVTLFEPKKGPACCGVAFTVPGLFPVTDQNCLVAGHLFAGVCVVGCDRDRAGSIKTTTTPVRGSDFGRSAPGHDQARGSCRGVR